MNINIKVEEVIKAKKDMGIFDAQKDYDKFECHHNYIGLLGEMVLNRYFMEQKLGFKWVQFIKQGVLQPDFIIKGCTIDLKTSRGKDLWVGKTVPHKIYISAHINKYDNIMIVQGWLPSTQIKTLRKEVKFWDGKVTYKVCNEDLYPIEWLTGVFPSSPLNHIKNEAKRI